MRVVVCIKQVGYICHPIAMTHMGGEIDPEKMVHMLNPFDELAMEEAIRIKESFPGTEVIAVTLGPPPTEEALRYAFSFGADKMIRINSRNLDPWSTATALAQITKGLDYDIILCGKKAIDSNDNMVGSFLAELLGIGHVAGIVKLDIFPEKKKAIVERSVGRGDREVIECRLPALFTAEKGLNEPRYPTLPNRLRTERESVRLVEIDSFGMESSTDPELNMVTTLSPPRPKPKKVFTPDSNLSASERRRLIMSGGGKTDKKGDMIGGAPDKIAETIIKVLIQEKII